MKESTSKKKALALFSGGLDSMLAIKLITLQGIEVTAINMNIGFGSRTDVSDIMRERARIAGADFEVIDVRYDYLKSVLFNPKYGYGKYFNPCIDCHGFMFRVAKEYLSHFGASFMITGEVLGQRPMSQRAEAMNAVRKLALDEDALILRPLCARNMEITTPEREGWVDREKLLSITGRSREAQLKLAKEFGWDNFQSPAGGCLLTDPHFSKKMKEFIEHEDLHVADIEILKNGRHLRLPDGAKLVIGRDEAENIKLLGISTDKFLQVSMGDIPGPLSLISATATQNDLELCAKIILSFAKTSSLENYDVQIGRQTIKASPFLKRKDTHQYFII